MTEGKKESLADRAITWLCILILVGLCIREFSHLYRTPDSIAKHDDAYESHFIVSASFPFIGRYFLLPPERIEPGQRYPLTVVLQGRSSHIYAADTLASPAFRRRYPGFVLVPIAPVRSLWETPANDDYSMPGLPFPDAMPQVLDEIENLVAAGQIDPSRIYLTGHSMGGMGVIGALEQHPGLFAGGLVLSGMWDPAQTTHIDAPVGLFHGSADAQIPAPVARRIASSLHARGKTVFYEELEGAGHDIWKIVYPSTQVWDWLYAQRRADVAPRRD